MEKIKTHYDNLQVTENASPEVIRGAYRYLSQKWHPDRNPRTVEQATRITQIINEAFAVLSDPHRRREHDVWIQDQRAAQAAKERVEPKSASEEPAQKAPAPAPGIYRILRSGPTGILATSFAIGAIVAIVYSGGKDRGVPEVPQALLSVVNESDAALAVPAESAVESAALPVGPGEPPSLPQSSAVYPLTIVNRCSEALRFAMAYRGTDGQMHVAGWVSLASGETGYVRRLIAGPSVFLYGESDSAQFVWNGNDHADALTAMVAAGHFNYGLARVASLEVSGFHPVKFFAITMQKDGGQFDFQCY